MTANCEGKQTCINSSFLYIKVHKSEAEPAIEEQKIHPAAISLMRLIHLLRFKAPATRDDSRRVDLNLTHLKDQQIP